LLYCVHLFIQQLLQKYAKIVGGKNLTNNILILESYSETSLKALWQLD